MNTNDHTTLITNTNVNKTMARLTPKTRPSLPYYFNDEDCGRGGGDCTSLCVVPYRCRRRGG